MSVDMNMNILVVDDFKTMVKVVESLLKQMGFKNIDEANSGGEALEKMRLRKYGLVLTDWNMEPMTGLELLQQIRMNPSTKQLPVIMITAESKPENIAEAKRSGASNYVVKPFNAATLKEKITAVIGQF